MIILISNIFRLTFAFLSLSVPYGGPTEPLYAKPSYNQTAADLKDSPSSPTSGELYQEIAHMDSLLFNAFNRRDIRSMKACFDSSLEVYQDNQGLRNYTESMEAFAGLFTKDYVLTRRLRRSSMEVYPIKDFGAIQTGIHTFSHTEDGKVISGTFKFMHIWHNHNGTWKITRLITYDH